MTNKNKEKYAYTKPCLLVYDSVKNITMAVSDGSVDEPEGDGLN